MTTDFWIGAVSGGFVIGAIAGAAGFVVARLTSANAAIVHAEAKEAAVAKEATAARDAIAVQLAKDVKETAAMPADKVLDALNDDFAGFDAHGMQLGGAKPTGGGEPPTK